METLEGANDERSNQPYSPDRNLDGLHRIPILRSLRNTMIIEMKWNDLVNPLLALCSEHVDKFSLQADGSCLVIKSRKGKSFVNRVVVEKGPQSRPLSAHNVLYRLCDTHDCVWIRVEVKGSELFITGKQ